MLQEIETNIQIQSETISLSPAAAAAVRNILAERQLDDYSLRVYVAGSGCCGVQFGMALDNNIRANDQTFTSEGVQIVVDDMSIDYLRGATVDFINDPQHGAGFVVDSPSNVGSSCGCGGHDEASAESGSTCACGGNCDCGN